MTQPKARSRGTLSIHSKVVLAFLLVMIAITVFSTWRASQREQVAHARVIEGPILISLSGKDIYPSLAHLRQVPTFDLAREPRFETNPVFPESPLPRALLYDSPEAFRIFSNINFFVATTYGEYISGPIRSFAEGSGLEDYAILSWNLYWMEPDMIDGAKNQWILMTRDDMGDGTSHPPVVTPGEEAAATWLDPTSLSRPLYVLEMGGVGWAPYYLDIKPGDLDEAHDLGLAVLPWGMPADQPALYQQILEAGADGLILQ